METSIRMALIYAGITQSSLAKTLGMSQQSFSAKLKRDTWTVSELRTLAAALGSDYVSYFEFSDGKKI
jgi:DNA-binding XRE family transcriptional regulator